jgi:hypothetical protein
MEAVFSVWFVSKCYKKGQSSSGECFRVEAGSNTSTVALRVVGVRDVGRVTE